MTLSDAFESQKSIDDVQSRVSIEAEAFESRVTPLIPDLLRYFIRRVVPVDDSSDCLSETLLVLWRQREKLPASDSDLRPWAYGVARKVVANHQRKRNRRSSIDSRVRDVVDHYTVPEVPLEAQPVMDALRKLSPDDQELVRLIAWDGFGVAEAGAVLGLNPGTARSRYFRARERLRRQLDR